MKHDELNKHFIFVAYSRSIKDAFDTDDTNSIQSVTGHASYMKKVHSLAFYDPVARDRPEYGRCSNRIPTETKIFIFSAINSEHNERKTFLNGKAIND